MGGVCVLQQLLGPADHSFFGLGQLDAEISDASGLRQVRLAGPIGETNRFAQIMAVLIPVAAGLVMAERGLRKVPWAVALVLIGAGVALSFSRGAIVGLALAAPFACLFRLVRVRHLVAAAAAAGCLVVAMPHYAERIFSIASVALQAIDVRTGGLRNSDGAARGRMTEMKSAMLVFVEHPVLGGGPGLAPYYYDENAGVIGGKVRQGRRQSHNLFLQLGAETGILGLVAFAGVVALVFRGLDDARRRLEISDRQLWAIAAGLEVALIVSLATSLFLHASYIRYFWLLLGLSASASMQEGAPALVRLLSRMLHETAQRIRADA
jgi:O-antigen ligase